MYCPSNQRGGREQSRRGPQNPILVARAQDCMGAPAGPASDQWSRDMHAALYGFLPLTGDGLERLKIGLCRELVPHAVALHYGTVAVPLCGPVGRPVGSCQSALSESRLLRMAVLIDTATFVVNTARRLFHSSFASAFPQAPQLLGQASCM